MTKYAHAVLLTAGGVELPLHGVPDKRSAAIIIESDTVNTIQLPDGRLLYVDACMKDRPFSQLNKIASDIATQAGIPCVFGDALLLSGGLP